MAHPQRIALALQGGGAHGAFTWGVLDRLSEAMEAGELAVTAISGASAGALNAATFAAGLAETPDRARRQLRRLWETIDAQANVWSSPTPPWLSPQRHASTFNRDWTPAALFREFWRLVVSPYDLWWYENPLRAIAAAAVDFERLNDTARAPRLYLSATEVTTTRRDIFTQPTLHIDHLLASACIPEAFRAVTIGEGIYWDGGFLGNPPLEPLFEHADDLVVVWINPLNRANGAPRSARDIIDRLNEITFNISLVAELRGIHTINKLLAAGSLPARYRPIRVHFIEDQSWMSDLGLASKTAPPPGLIPRLHERGYAAAQDWVRDVLPRMAALPAAEAGRSSIEALLERVRYPARSDGAPLPAAVPLR